MYSQRESKQKVASMLRNKASESLSQEAKKE